MKILFGTNKSRTKLSREINSSQLNKRQRTLLPGAVAEAGDKIGGGASLQNKDNLCFE